MCIQYEWMCLHHWMHLTFLLEYLQSLLSLNVQVLQILRPAALNENIFLVVLWGCVVDRQPLLVFIILWASCSDGGERRDIDSHFIEKAGINARWTLICTCHSFGRASMPLFWTIFIQKFISYVQAIQIFPLLLPCPLTPNTTHKHSTRVHLPKPLSALLWILCTSTLHECVAVNCCTFDAAHTSNLLSRAVWQADVPAWPSTANYCPANLLQYLFLACPWGGLDNLDCLHVKMPLNPPATGPNAWELDQALPSRCLYFTTAKNSGDCYNWIAVNRNKACKANWCCVPVSFSSVKSKHSVGVCRNAVIYPFLVWSKQYNILLYIHVLLWNHVSVGNPSP